MATSRSKKEEQLQKLENGFEKAKGIVFSGYRGLTVAQMTDLRSALGKEDAEYMVAKKTLIRKTAEKHGIGNIPEDILDGPVGITFSYNDEVTAARLTNKFAQKNKSLVLRGGVISGAILSETEVNNLAILPGKDELRAKVIGTFIAPVRGFVCTLNGVISGFVRVLDGIQKQKPSTN